MFVCDYKNLAALIRTGSHDFPSPATEVSSATFSAPACSCSQLIMLLPRCAALVATTSHTVALLDPGDAPGVVQPQFTGY